MKNHQMAQGKFEIQDTESCVHIPKTDQYETKRELKLQYHCNFVKTQHKKYDSKYYKKRNTTCKKMRVQTILEKETTGVFRQEYQPV